MVFCIIALVVFSFLGIFSAKYRAYAKEAYRCVFRMITLRPCDTAFDQKVKSKITGRLMNRSPSLARFVFRHFNALSWLLVVSMFVSIFFTGLGLYNLAVYGNCNGPESTDICVLNPEGTSIVGSFSLLKPELVTSDDDPYIGSGNITIIEFGCHACPYTKKAEPILKELLQKYDVRLVFRDFPVERHKLSREAAEASECAHEQGVDYYWKYHDKLFERQKELGNETFRSIAKEIGLDMERFNSCYDSGKYKEEVEKDFLDGQAAGVYGTPTFFIGNVTVVGPKPLPDFEKAIKGQAVETGDINACVE